MLGFPCDQFGHQEPGSEEEIRAFCSTKYDVSFPLHAKIEVNGANAHPLYRWLKGEKPGVFGTEGIKWNFTKFWWAAMARDPRYAPTDTPAGIEKDILRAPTRRRAEIARSSTQAGQSRRQPRLADRARWRQGPHTGTRTGPGRPRPCPA